MTDPLQIRLQVTVQVPVTKKPVSRSAARKKTNDLSASMKQLTLEDELTYDTEGLTEYHLKNILLLKQLSVNLDRIRQLPGLVLKRITAITTEDDEDEEDEVPIDPEEDEDDEDESDTEAEMANEVVLPENVETLEEYTVNGKLCLVDFEKGIIYDSQYQEIGYIDEDGEFKLEEE